jgi:hypothetical protein
MAALEAMFPKTRPCVFVMAIGVMMRAVALEAAVAEEPCAFTFKEAMLIRITPVRMIVTFFIVFCFKLLLFF